MVSGSQWEEGPTYQEKLIFLISKPVWTNLVTKHYVLINIVIIASVSVGGLRSPVLLPPGPEWFREVICRPPYGLASLH